MFLAFFQLDLQVKFIPVMVLIFGVCVLMVRLGRVPLNLLKIPSPYFMILMGGFETGMLGYSIFISLYGTGIPPDRGSDQGACVSLCSDAASGVGCGEGL